MNGKRELLIVVPLDEARMQRFKSAYIVHDASNPKMRDTVIKGAGARAAAVLTSGSKGFTATEIDAMPNLEIICALGAGTEGIDKQAAQARGIRVVNTSGANAATVADHAVAMLLAIGRGIVQYDRSVRAGFWKKLDEQRSAIHGKRTGIVGLGNVGQEVAQRASGLGMTVAYCSRRRRGDSPLAYFDSIAEIASWTDFIVLCCPGGAETYHLVNAGVLDALGPSGYLINVARGSVVDTDALVHALNAGIIAGAALDVVEEEPEVSRQVLEARNLILTPHVAGRSPEAIRATTDAVFRTLEEHFRSASSA